MIARKAAAARAPEEAFPPAHKSCDQRALRGRIPVEAVATALGGDDGEPAFALVAPSQRFFKGTFRE